MVHFRKKRKKWHAIFIPENYTYFLGVSRRLFLTDMYHTTSMCQSNNNHRRNDCQWSTLFSGMQLWRANEHLIWYHVIYIVQIYIFLKKENDHQQLIERINCCMYVFSAGYYYFNKNSGVSSCYLLFFRRIYQIAAAAKKTCSWALFWFNLAVRKKMLLFLWITCNYKCTRQGKKGKVF